MKGQVRHGFHQFILRRHFEFPECYHTFLIKLGRLSLALFQVEIQALVKEGLGAYQLLHGDIQEGMHVNQPVLLRCCLIL
jgi:hypothetical protein